MNDELEEERKMAEKLPKRFEFKCETFPTFDIKGVCLCNSNKEICLAKEYIWVSLNIGMQITTKDAYKFMQLLAKSQAGWDSANYKIIIEKEGGGHKDSPKKEGSSKKQEG